MFFVIMFFVIMFFVIIFFVVMCIFCSDRPTADLS
jgi:hypothetical protein